MGGLPAPGPARRGRAAAAGAWQDRGESRGGTHGRAGGLGAVVAEMEARKRQAPAVEENVCYACASAGLSKSVREQYVRPWILARRAPLPHFPRAPPSVILSSLSHTLFFTLCLCCAFLR